MFCQLYQDLFWSSKGKELMALSDLGLYCQKYILLCSYGILCKGGLK